MIRNLIVAYLLVVMLMGGVSTSLADTLFRRKSAILIGHGKLLRKNTIRWTDCDKKPLGDFAKPPHWFKEDDCCKFQPFAFGLEQRKGNFLIVDKAKLETIFPDAKVGETVGFKVENDAVVLRHHQETVEISKQIPSGWITTDVIAIHGVAKSEGGTLKIFDRFRNKTWDVENAGSFKDAHGKKVTATGYPSGKQRGVHVLSMKSF